MKKENMFHVFVIIFLVVMYIALAVFFWFLGKGVAARIVVASTFNLLILGAVSSILYILAIGCVLFALFLVLRTIMTCRKK